MLEATNPRGFHDVVCFLFTDCFIVSIELRAGERYEPYLVMMIDHHSKCYAKPELKLHQNLIKVTGKHKCAILVADSMEFRDLVIIKV